MSLQPVFESLRIGAEKLCALTANQKNAALRSVKAALLAHEAGILAANEIDVTRARESGMKESLVDRLTLNHDRWQNIASCIDTVIAQTDPVGEMVAGWNTVHGLTIRQVRVPLGVAAIIYESRPNVTVDAFALAYKSGNAILLRGSSSALESNKAIVAAIKAGLSAPVGEAGATLAGAGTSLAGAGATGGAGASLVAPGATGGAGTAFGGGLLSKAASALGAAGTSLGGASLTPDSTALGGGATGGAGTALGAGSASVGVPKAVELAASGDRAEVDEILTAKGYIDVALPRGGANLIKMVCEKATVPVIETGSGICHLYVDATGDIDMACRIAENAKLQRPGVCNAIEVCLVHKDAAAAFLPRLMETLAGRAQFRCDPEALRIMQAALQGAAIAQGTAAGPAPTTANGKPLMVPAGEADFDTEFLDNILAVKVVSSIEKAVSHINAHNTKHSESIITRDTAAARYFQRAVDAACVYVNASTRFTDGEMFGYGAELGISTQKMHVRGPMGLTALTTVKYLIDGDGQIR